MSNLLLEQIQHWRRKIYTAKSGDYDDVANVYHSVMSDIEGIPLNFGTKHSLGCDGVLGQMPLRLWADIGDCVRAFERGGSSHAVGEVLDRLEIFGLWVEGVKDDSHEAFEELDTYLVEESLRTLNGRLSGT